MPVPVGDRIKDDVVVDVGLIHMGADDHLEPVQILLGEPIPDLVGQLRGDLPGPKALDQVIGLDAVGPPEAALGVHPGPGRRLRLAAQGRDEHLLVRLLGVDHIPDQVVETGGLGQNLGHRHWATSSRSCRWRAFTRSHSA